MISPPTPLLVPLMSDPLQRPAFHLYFHPSFHSRFGSNDKSHPRFNSMFRLSSYSSSLLSFIFQSQVLLVATVYSSSHPSYSVGDLSSNLKRNALESFIVTHLFVIFSESINKQRFKQNKWALNNFIHFLLSQ